MIDARTENVVVYPAFIALIITFGISICGWMLLLAGVFLGIGYGNLSSSMQAIAIKVSPTNKYGIATSTYFIGLDIGIGFGPSLLGLFTGFISYTEVYIIMAIVAALSTVLYFIVHGRKVKTIKLISESARKYVNISHNLLISNTCFNFRFHFIK